MTGRATCVGALVACAACGAAKVPAAHVPDAGPTPAAAAPAPRPPRLAGVPHTQAIRGATLAPDGRAALTVDGRGSVRLWTALDGTAAPAAVALREVQDLSIVAAPGGFAVGTVDATGTARLSRVSPDGAVAEVAVVPPFPPAEAIEVLPDGRFVVLGTDRRLDLYDATGHRTAALERAAFHATRMVRAGAGVLVYEPGADEVTRVDAGAGSLEARSVRASVPVDGEVAVSDDGRTLALHTRRAGEPRVVVVALEGAPERAIPIAATTPRLAFRGADLLVYDAAGSYRVTPTGDVLRLAETPCARGLVAAAGGTRLASFGTWLYTERESGLYLGHELRRGGDYRLSPDGTRIARIAEGKVVLDGVEVREAAMAEFLSDALVVVATPGGGLMLVDATTGEVKDEIDAGGAVREMEAGTRQALVRIVTQRGITQLYTVRDGRFRGPYVVGEVPAASGLLEAGGPTEPMLWTLAAGIVRRHTLAELEAGVPLAAIGATGETEPAANAVPDRLGRRFATSWNGRAYVLTRVGGPSVELAGATTFVVPSPRGDVVLASLGAGGIAAFRPDTMERLWTVPGARLGAAFAAGARRALLTSAGGAMVVDTATGEVVERICGPAFVARRSPPPNAPTPAAPGMCEP